MKVFVDFGRWTTTKTALTVAGLLAVAIDSAVAMSPIVQPPIKWQGIVEFRLKTPGSSAFKAFTVPAGKNFMLTDLIVTNRGSLNESFSVHRGAGGACGTLTLRIEDMYVRSGDNVILSFQTGINFGPGTAVCLGASNADVMFNARGFLYTAAP